METLTVRSRRRNEMIEITHEVRTALNALGAGDGVATVFVPHTTAGITINENADPDVVHDMLLEFDRLVPERQPYFRHAEGNSDSHVKATLVGSSVQIPILAGRLAFGTWQGIWFCEFDGPRTRRVHVTWTGRV